MEFEMTQDSPQADPDWPMSEEMTALHEINIHISELLHPDGANVSVAFRRAEMYPPITAQSLAELDMHRIINNPKLRHDINFDRELHFRPNLDGVKGRQKLRAADGYWLALKGEFFMYTLSAYHINNSSDPETVARWEMIMQYSQRRLPKLFETIRDILKTLVPDHERDMVSRRLDVDLIMQQISRGMCNLEELSDWLASLLQAHCAPMRDKLIRVMKEELRAGVSDDNAKMLVFGLRRLMNILEVMRLDVANHQIRQMRPWLINDSVDFQRRYNTNRISMGGKMDLLSARKWYDDEVDLLSSHPVSFSPTQTLASALLRELLFNEKNAYPQTFNLDLERLRMIRINLQTHIFLSICSGILADLLPSNIEPATLIKAITKMNDSMMAIVGCYGLFYDRLENVAAEIIRISLSIEGRPSSCEPNLSDFVESRLEAELGISSPSFDMHARLLFERLSPKLHNSVRIHARLTATQLQEALLPKASARGSAAVGFGAVCAPPLVAPSFDPDSEVIRRITHVVCLHWQVWSELVYLLPIEDLSMLDSATKDSHLSTGPRSVGEPQSPTNTETNFLSTNTPVPDNTSKQLSTTSSTSTAQNAAGVDRDDAAPEQSSVDPRSPTLS